MAAEEITARILDRDYRLSCSSDEKPALVAAIERVDREMRSIRQEGKVTNAERIAVLAPRKQASVPTASRDVSGGSVAAFETHPSGAVAHPAITRRMRAIDALLDDALGPQEPLF